MIWLSEHKQSLRTLALRCNLVLHVVLETPSGVGAVLCTAHILVSRVAGYIGFGISPRALIVQLLAIKTLPRVGISDTKHRD